MEKKGERRKGKGNGDAADSEQGFYRLWGRARRAACTLALRNSSSAVSTAPQQNATHRNESTLCVCVCATVHVLLHRATRPRFVWSAQQ